MLDSFWTWLQNEFWAKLRDSILGLLGPWLVDKFNAAATLFYGIWAAVGSVLIVMQALVYWAIQQIAESLADIDLQAIKTGSASLLQYGAFINRFIPLTEGAAVAIIVFNIWFVVVVIRWIKSFIPFMSN